MPKTVFTAQTTAVAIGDVDPIVVPDRDGMGIKTLIVGGLSGADEVELHINTIGTSYEQMVDSSGNGVVLSLAAGNTIALDQPGRYKVVKGVTTGSVSCAVADQVKP